MRVIQIHKWWCTATGLKNTCEFKNNKTKSCEQPMCDVNSCLDTNSCCSDSYLLLINLPKEDVNRKIM